jgi:hypothetical protein
MSEIPDDIYEVAHSVMRAQASPSHALRLESIARAILAERARCAKVADEWAWDDRCVAAAIAASIRTPGEEQ